MRRWTSAAARRLVKIAFPELSRSDALHFLGSPHAIERAAATVAHRYLDGMQTLPTDLSAIAGKLGISCVVEADIPFSGELRRERGELMIVVSKFLSKERARFTTAHELGHAVFEQDDPNCPKFGEELEEICDALASEFLFPKHQFESRVDRPHSVANLLALSRLFGTSIAATAHRYHRTTGCSVFAVVGDSVTWGFGEVKASKTTQLYPSIARAVSDESAFSADCRAIVDYPIGTCGNRWLLERAKLKRDVHSVFLMRPYPASVEKQELNNTGSTINPNSKPLGQKEVFTPAEVWAQTSMGF